MKTDKSITQRTEEVRDIIDRMPYGIGKIVALIVVGLAVLLLFVGLMIDYPEKVSGPISTTSRQAPVRLVAITVQRSISIMKSKVLPIY